MGVPTGGNTGNAVGRIAIDTSQAQQAVPAMQGVAQGINRAEVARLIEKDPRFDLLLQVDPRMEPLLLGPAAPPPPARTAPAGNAPLIFSLPPTS
jgi:hypothetical protein